MKLHRCLRSANSLAAPRSRPRRSKLKSPSASTRLVSSASLRSLLTALSLMACVWTIAPRESWGGPIRVFIMAGQSNMAGGAPDPAPSNLSPQNNVLYQYRLQASAGRKESTTWESLRSLAGLGVGSSYGPELTFAKSMSQRVSEPIAIIKVAANGTNLYSHWDPTRTDVDALYPWMIEKVESALNQLASLNYQPIVDSFVWVQGEGDAAFLSTATGYQNNLSQFAASVRNDLGISNLKFVINELHANVDRANASQLRQSQRNLAAADPNFRIVNADDLTLLSDNVHFTSAMHMELGRRLADVLSPSADFNYDGAVNGLDLAIWKSAFGVNRQGDGNSDGVTDGRDFMLWQRQMSALGGTPQLATVPEPGGLVGAAAALLLLAMRGRGSKTRR